MSCPVEVSPFIPVFGAAFADPVSETVHGSASRVRSTCVAGSLDAGSGLAQGSTQRRAATRLRDHPPVFGELEANHGREPEATDQDQNLVGLWPTQFLTSICSATSRTHLSTGRSPSVKIVTYGVVLRIAQTLIHTGKKWPPGSEKAEFRFRKGRISVPKRQNGF